MPVKSYLVYPQDGKKSDIVRILSKIECCEVLPSENTSVVILITATATKLDEEVLQATISEVKEVKYLSLISGFTTY